MIDHFLYALHVCLILYVRQDWVFLVRLDN